MSPFTPSGEIARWRMLYRVLQNTPVGSVATYQQLAGALNVDPVTGRHVIQGNLRRAQTEFEIVDKHAIEVVTNVGYRVVEVADHLRLARIHERKARGQLRRGESKLVNIDLIELSKQPATVQKLIHNANLLVKEQLDFNRRTSIRQEKLEAALKTVEKRSDATTEQVAALEERLEELKKTAAEREQLAAEREQSAVTNEHVAELESRLRKLEEEGRDT